MLLKGRNIKMNYDQLKKELNSVSLEGRNLGNIGETSFNLLTEFDFSEYLKFDDFPIKEPEEVKLLLKRLEQRYQEMYQKLEQDSSIKPMEYGEDGKVVIKPGMAFHRTIQNIEALKNISIGGVLASEWFGQLESEHEGCFCAFLNTTNNPEEAKNHSMKNHNQTMGLATLDPNKDCVIYFDSEHPILKELMDMDFFEYEHLKETSPEKIHSRYSKDMIELFENLISPLSECGYGMHDNPNSESACWVAIPGGIPPQLINGVCISSKNVEMNAKVSYLMELFPNATIFDESRTVLNKNREINELTQLDELVLKDKLEKMSLGELSATKKGFEGKLEKAKDLLTMAKATKTKKELKNQGKDGGEHDR